MIHLNLDENNYLLSVATIGGGISAEIDLAEFDLTGGRMRAHKWDGKTLIFDAERYAEIEAEKERETKPTGKISSVYDELAEAYREGVQEA
jgi:hypothetical protein